MSSLRLSVPLRAMALLTLAMATGAGVRPAAAQEVSEVQVKAAFLLNFARFVEWPEAPNGPFTLCLAAADTFVESVRDSLRGQSVAGHELQIRQLQSGDSPVDCHVIFVGLADAVGAAELLRRVEGPVLTVGETLQFLRDGGMIRVFVEQSKVRFEIDQHAATAAGLKVSSHLLRLSAR